MPRSTIWCVSRFGLEIRYWEDGTAVFHRGSGNTHVITPDHGELLSIIMNGQCSSIDMLKQLPPSEDYNTQARLEGWIWNALKQLERLQLIEPIQHS